MRASLSYRYQKATSLFIVVSAFVFAVSYAFQNTLVTLASQIRMTSALVFLLSFAFYSYLRAHVLFTDYIKCYSTRSLASTIVLLINVFTLITAIIATIYINFYY